ncbi:hypothetical protein [Shewanella sp. UCD-KL12]|uniref:hypothetical protein n=1 Tax=Shewanella sp. UCD-KL12 TaxID=1917163 RepID=UPI0011809D85|nr:hypothetical protein [Shewanella sp. UCD-KL12]
MESQNGISIPSVDLDEIYPNPDVIISQDGDKVVSRFRNDEWDFSPYSPSPNKEPTFNFIRSLTINDYVGTSERKVIEEIKHLLLVLLYVNRGGRFGSISVTTLRKYFYALAAMGRFCLSVQSEDRLHDITVKKLFSQSHLFNLFARLNPSVLANRSMIDTFNSFRPVSQKYLGFKVAQVNFDENASRHHNQHPVIPGGIYLNLVNGLSSDIDYIGIFSGRLTALIAEFEDKCVGRTHSMQKTLKVSKKEYRMTASEVIQRHDLRKLLVERYNVTSLATLITALYKIQFICLHTIVLYTGMRLTEALNMPFDCIQREVLSPGVVDIDGIVAVEPDVINLVSYTTKFTGIKETASWLANSDVEKAINILKSINLGFCQSEKKDFRGTLFVSPNHLKGKSRVRTVFKPSTHQPEWYKNLIIKQEDLDILRATNPEDKLEGGAFILGKPWPLAAHQFRRSLAFYAANSGFVSLPTLTVQFKHLASSMTKYYCRNYEVISSIFGYFNPKSNSFELPQEHTLLDFKEARLTVVVDTLVSDVLHSDEVLYGKSGNYIQRLRSDIESDDAPVDILEVRQKTEEAVSRGEVHYRQTLLGGCTNAEQCDCLMLGEFTSCLSNACAVIKPVNVSEQITELTKYINLLKPNTGEYQVVDEELRELIALQNREKRRAR